jgi:hypothetical protein
LRAQAIAVEDPIHKPPATLTYKDLNSQITKVPNHTRSTACGLMGGISRPLAVSSEGS